MAAPQPLVGLVFFLREVPRFVADGVFRLVHAAQKHWKAARKSHFDTAPRDGFVIADTAHGRYVVSPRDRVISRAIVADGVFDFDKVERALAAIGPDAAGMTLVDIGANIGSIAIPLVLEGRVAEAIAVEPEPLNFRLLQMNILFNGLERRIVPVRGAVSARDGTDLVLALSADNLGDHRVVAAGSEAARHRGTVSVPGQRLDTLLAPHAKRDFLVWIDVQGFEGEVLAGAPETLSRRPPLVIEFWPEALDANDGYGLVKAALVAAGYRSVVDLLDPAAEVEDFTPARLDALRARYAALGDATDLLLR